MVYDVRVCVCVSVWRGGTQSMHAAFYGPVKDYGVLRAQKSTFDSSYDFK